MRTLMFPLLIPALIVGISCADTSDRGASAAPSPQPEDTVITFSPTVTPTVSPTLTMTMTPAPTPRATPTPSMTPVDALLKAAHQPLSEEMTARIKSVSTPSEALAIVSDLKYENLLPEVRVNSPTGVRQIVYKLPEAAANNPNIILVLGQRLPTRFRERLPEGVLAVVSQFPKDAVACLGPFIWVQTDYVARLLYKTDVRTVYHALNYPESLFAEIYIRAPLYYPNLIGWWPFPPSDRIGRFVGEDFGKDAMGWPYLYVGKKGDWRLREYPNIPEEGNAALMGWVFTRVNPETGKREFTIPIHLIGSQSREQRITIANPRRPQDNVGPSIIFRTDDKTGQSDIIATPPYIYLDNAQLFKDIIYKTPLPDGSVPDPENVIAAAGDLHYSSNGKIGLILAADEGPFWVKEGEGEMSVSMYEVLNQVGFYIGKRGPKEESSLETGSESCPE